MIEPERQTGHILARLQGIDELRPAEELQAYEHVLAQLTDLLNAPEDHDLGGS